MSIYIPKVDIPKDHGITLFVLTNGNVYYDGVLLVGKAIQVPDHGDLIDREMLLALMPDVWLDIEHCGYIEDTVYGQSIERIRHAPTIIPAEEGET